MLTKLKRQKKKKKRADAGRRQPGVEKKKDELQKSRKSEMGKKKKEKSLQGRELRTSKLGDGADEGAGWGTQNSLSSTSSIEGSGGKLEGVRSDAVLNKVVGKAKNCRFVPSGVDDSQGCNETWQMEKDRRVPTPSSRHSRKNGASGGAKARNNLLSRTFPPE